MKWNEMQNLFIGYNENEDFRILICAWDEHEATQLALGYGAEAHLNGDWEVTEIDTDIDNIRFDCDYVIA